MKSSVLLKAIDLVLESWGCQFSGSQSGAGTRQLREQAANRFRPQCWQVRVY